MFGTVGLPFNFRVENKLRDPSFILDIWYRRIRQTKYFWSQSFKRDAWDLSQRSHRTYIFLLFWSKIPKSCRLNSIGDTPGPISRTSIDLMARVIPALLASKLITNNPSNISLDQKNICDWLTDWLGDGDDSLCKVRTLLPSLSRPEMMKSNFLCLTNRKEEGPGTVEVESEPLYLLVCCPNIFCVQHW